DHVQVDDVAGPAGVVRQRAGGAGGGRVRGGSVAAEQRGEGRPADGGGPRGGEGAARQGQGAIVGEGPRGGLRIFLVIYRFALTARNDESAIAAGVTCSTPRPGSSAGWPASSRRPGSGRPATGRPATRPPPAAYPRRWAAPCNGPAGPPGCPAPPATPR